MTLIAKAQYEKALPDVWGEFPVLDFERLPEEWQERLASIPTPESVLPFDQLAANANPELDAGWVTAVEQGWTENVLQQ